MGIQTIYTQVDNAKIEQCKKGKPVPPMQIPLLRNNYLGEYRTQTEKDKVLKNLGILGVTDKYTYPSQDEVTSFTDIATIQQALDYCIRLIKSYEASDNNISQLLSDVKAIKTELAGLDTEVSNNIENIDNINTKIESINSQITTINNTIASFDQKLQDLDVDDKITKRLHQHIDSSSTIKFTDDTLEVKNSVAENNAIEVKSDGLYVTDNSEKIEANTQAITQLQSEVKDTDKYITTVEGTSPYQVGGIAEGTTAESLNGKSISDILDMMLFPTVTRDLVQPTLTYEEIDSLVAVGSKLDYPKLVFEQNDAGPQYDEESQVTYNGKSFTGSTYTSIGEYTFNASVYYNAGDYISDNKGNVTDKRVNAGVVSTSLTVTATYPWYAGNTTAVSKQDLVPFNQDTEIIELTLGGQTVIKLPGANSKLNTFKVNGGLGFLNVDLDGWTTSEEQINGITYQVWTKNESYTSELPHQIQFKLVQ